MTIETISDVQLRDHTKMRRLLCKTIEKASVFALTTEFQAKDGDVFSISKEIANLDAADISCGQVMHACRYIGGYVEQDADEGTNGTITVEKWDDVSGSNQTAMTAAVVLDAGAAAITALTALTTADAEIAAGYKINIVTAGVDGSPTGRVTLFFQKMEAAGDVYVGALLYDAEFLGGYWEQDSDEGTDGTILIEKWDDVAGSNQTAISASGTVDAAAASLEELTAVSDGEEVVAAGYKINVKLATFTRSPTGRVTLFFKHVDDVDT